MIVAVDARTLPSAAAIHAEAWRASHKVFCSEAFVKAHTAARQEEYLRCEMRDGKKLYMLIDNQPVGIVSVKDGQLIENLYVLPSRQRKGYGTQLLRFAIGQCTSTPRLWILDNNKRAYAFYTKNGFRLTGQAHRLSDTLSEVEMAQTAGGTNT